MNEQSLLLFIGILISVLPFLFTFYFAKKQFFILLKDSRLSRVVYYLIMMGFGASLSINSYTDLLHIEVLLHFILYFFVLFYAGTFAIIVNNIEDLEIDKITNLDRPLVKSLIAMPVYFKIGFFCLIYSLMLSLFIGVSAFLSICGISIIYYLYSSSPFRLKRYVIFAKFLIGFNSFIVALYGFVAIGGDKYEFPIQWAIFILVPISLMANFIDLKDTEGDRASNIKTLSVIFGQKNATIMIASFTLISYAYASILLNNVFIYFMNTLICFLHIFLLLRLPYKERPLFLLHNSLFIGLILLIFK